jgi:hypothetical protein
MPLSNNPVPTITTMTTFPTPNIPFTYSCSVAVINPGWEGTQHIPNFKDGSTAYWQECLALAPRLIRVFALALDLDEDYFDDLVTHVSVSLQDACVT